MAASVPRMVAMTAAITATAMVTCSACMMERSRNSSAYHLKEKPSHLARLLPALKDWKIITTMGI